MKYLIVLCFMLVGCERSDVEYPVKPKMLTAVDSGVIALSFAKLCIDGVEYLHNDGGNTSVMVPHFKPDGSLYTCQ